MVVRRTGAVRRTTDTSIYMAGYEIWKKGGVDGGRGFIYSLLLKFTTVENITKIYNI